MIFLAVEVTSILTLKKKLAVTSSCLDNMTVRLNF